MPEAIPRSGAIKAPKANNFPVRNIGTRDGAAPVLDIENRPRYWKYSDFRYQNIHIPHFFGQRIAWKQYNVELVSMDSN